MHRLQRSTVCGLQQVKINKISSDDDSTDIPITSNNSTIDMLNIDFNIPSKKLKVMIPPQSLKSRSDFCDYLFQDDASASISKTDSNHTLIDNRESIQDKADILKTDSNHMLTDNRGSIPKEITDSIQLFTDGSESNPLFGEEYLCKCHQSH